MRRLRLPLALLVLAAAVAFAFDGWWPWARLHVAVPIVVSRAFTESSDTLQQGETLAELFGRQGLAGPDLVSILQGIGLDPRRLRAGLVVQFRRDLGEPAPQEASLRTGPEERFELTRVAGGWTPVRIPISWKADVVRVEGGIDASLYDALDATIPDSLFGAGDRVRLAWDLADVYAWSLDFNRDIQPGDRFAVLAERLVSDEGDVRLGRILAADLLASGKHLEAYRFENGATKGFYDGEGNSLRRAFLRAPLEFRRVSSSFSRARYHPVLGVWRRHEGTDYAASRGTPVMAAGDGVVLRVGWSGGYGNLVELRHLNGITTRYGHLRGFASGIRRGARVSQGDFVGYVGATGLATASHLHYEFRVQGVARDSRRVDLGNGEPLERSLLPEFRQARARLVAVLGQAGAPPLPVRTD